MNKVTITKKDFEPAEEDEGLVCPECGEWFLVYMGSFGLGLNYCPCCGAECKDKQ